MRRERYIPSRLLSKLPGDHSRWGGPAAWTAGGLVGGMLLGWLMAPPVAPLLEHTMEIPPEYGRHILIMAAASGLAGFFYKRSRSRLDEEDLRQCLTRPILRPAGRAYLKSLLALAEGTGWSKQTVSEVARELRTLLDTYYDLQALQSVQETPARTQPVPEAMDDFDAEQLRQRVLALRQEAASIENAIQEVLTLRTPSGA